MSDLNEILVLIQMHNNRNPDHGVNCACMDRFIRQLSKMLLVEDQKAQQRVDHVVRSALNR